MKNPLLPFSSNSRAAAQLFPHGPSFSLKIPPAFRPSRLVYVLFLVSFEEIFFFEPKRLPIWAPFSVWVLALAVNLSHVGGSPHLLLMKPPRREMDVLLPCTLFPRQIVDLSFLRATGGKRSFFFLSTFPRWPCPPPQNLAAYSFKRSFHDQTRSVFCFSF